MDSDDSDQQTTQSEEQWDSYSSAASDPEGSKFGNSNYISRKKHNNSFSSPSKKKKNDSQKNLPVDRYQTARSDGEGFSTPGGGATSSRDFLSGLENTNNSTSTAVSSHRSTSLRLFFTVTARNYLARTGMKSYVIGRKLLVRLIHRYRSDVLGRFDSGNVQTFFLAGGTLSWVFRRYFLATVLGLGYMTSTVPSGRSFERAFKGTVVHDYLNSELQVA